MVTYYDTGLDKQKKSAYFWGIQKNSDCSFEHPKHIFRWLGKKIIAIFRSKILLSWTYVVWKIISVFQEYQYHQSVKQFGSRSGPMFCQAWSGSKLLNLQRLSVGKEFFWARCEKFCFGVCFQQWIRSFYTQSLIWQVIHGQIQRCVCGGGGGGGGEWRGPDAHPLENHKLGPPPTLDNYRLGWKLTYLNTSIYLINKKKYITLNN